MSIDYQVMFLFLYLAGHDIDKGVDNPKTGNFYE
jgi:hypothetical protein